MNPEQVARLSPSEKYDLFLGRYDYPLTRSEFEHTSSNDRHWEGYCHGTAPASINLIEPAPITMMNPDGVIVPFGSSDIKALLSYYYGKYFPYVRKIGSECRRRGNRRGSGSCAEDVNAGAFHIVMTHLLGRRHQAFIIDVATGLEIWNKAVFEFSSSIISESSEIPLDSAFGTTRRVKIETVISYGDNRRDQLSWDPTVGTPQYLKTQRTYQYWLELDGRDQIIGGEWISTEKPDAVWIKDRISFTGEFEALNQIYQPAR